MNIGPRPVSAPTVCDDGGAAGGSAKSPNTPRGERSMPGPPCSGFCDVARSFARRRSRPLARKVASSETVSFVPAFAGRASRAVDLCREGRSSTPPAARPPPTSRALMPERSCSRSVGSWKRWPRMRRSLDPAPGSTVRARNIGSCNSKRTGRLRSNDRWSQSQRVPCSPPRRRGACQ
jgi:hypothetical protein